MKQESTTLNNEEDNMKFPNKVYDLLKWLCIIVFPALATLYAVLAKIWGFPFETQIPATITAIATFIGALVGVSSLNYKGDE